MASRYSFSAASVIRMLAIRLSFQMTSDPFLDFGPRRRGHLPGIDQFRTPLEFLLPRWMDDELLSGLRRIENGFRELDPLLDRQRHHFLKQLFGGQLLGGRAHGSLRRESPNSPNCSWLRVRCHGTLLQPADGPACRP